MEKGWTTSNSLGSRNSWAARILSRTASSLNCSPSILISVMRLRKVVVRVENGGSAEID